MKRILNKYVKKMYLIDEYNTSKTSNLLYKEEIKTKEYEIEMISESKNKEQTIITKRMHEILTFKMDKKSIACNKKFKYDDTNEIKENTKIIVNRFIQRDKNAVLNFKTILNYYLLNNRQRPTSFVRKNKSLEVTQRNP